MKTTTYNKLIKRIHDAPAKENNNTWLLNFPNGSHPKDFKLKGVYLLGKNVKTNSMNWNFFDSIYCQNFNGSKIDAIGRVGKINYFLTFNH